MTAKQEIIKCEKCGSNNIKPMPLILGLFISAGCVMWIPILGWLLAPLLLAGMIAVMLIQLKVRLIQCQDCKHTFNVTAKKYKSYKNVTK